MTMVAVTEKSVRKPAQSAVEFAGRLLKTLPSEFASFGGAILAALGSAEIIGALGKSQALDILDPLFGLSFGHLMLVAGIIHLAVSFILLFTNWRTLGFGLTAWATGNFIIYRIALWNMGWHHSSGFIVEPLGISFKVTDFITNLLSALLFIGSCATLWIERRMMQTASSLKIFCPACGGHIKFAIQNLGQETSCPHCKTAITLRKPQNLKMSCFFCREHIEFPAHALGQKISCPHCKMSITLKELA